MMVSRKSAPVLTWDRRFELGIPSIDYEHELLIDAINETYEELDAARDVVHIATCLGEIHAMISGHFALEEREMRARGYPEFAAHKADHDTLLDELRDLMDQLEDDPDAGRERLAARLADWFVVHFQGFDARLHRAFHDTTQR